MLQTGAHVRQRGSGSRPRACNAIKPRPLVPPFTLQFALHFGPPFRPKCALQVALLFALQFTPHFGRFALEFALQTAAQFARLARPEPVDQRQPIGNWLQRVV
jgi:hypothetical protein